MAGPAKAVSPTANAGSVTSKAPASRPGTDLHKAASAAKGFSGVIKDQGKTAASPKPPAATTQGKPLPPASVAPPASTTPTLRQETPDPPPGTGFGDAMAPDKTPAGPFMSESERSWVKNDVGWLNHASQKASHATGEQARAANQFGPISPQAQKGDDDVKSAWHNQDIVKGTVRSRVQEMMQRAEEPNPSGVQYGRGDAASAVGQAIKGETAKYDNAGTTDYDAIVDDVLHTDYGVN